jgi:RNA polymerase subunit RPABC4/transcription elongation factor Spt4
VTNLPDLPSAEPPRPEEVPPTAASPKPCLKCKSETGGDPKCPVCGALQRNAKPCGICRELINFESNYCNACKSYQGYFRYVSLSQTMVALLATVLSLVLALIPQVDNFLRRESNTSFTVVGADGDAIYVRVMNSGRKPSIIRTCSLSIAGIKDPITLDLLNKDTHDAKNVIGPASEATVGLTATGTSSIPLDTILVTLQMNIDESSGVRVKREQFPAKRIREFFLGKKPSETF